MYRDIAMKKSVVFERHKMSGYSKFIERAKM